MDRQQTDRIDELTEAKEESLTYEQERRIHDSWQWLLQQRYGRVILRDLLQITHFGRSAFAGETNTTMKNTGLQEAAEYVMGRVNTCYPEAYALMLKEAREDQDNDRQSRNPSTRSNTSGNTSYRPDSGVYAAS